MLIAGYLLVEKMKLVTHHLCVLFEIDFCSRFPSINAGN